MKTLVAVRHAKSSWAEPGISDFDRPLNERGKKDAPEMARRLRQRNLSFDQFVSSPAKRAKKTASLFAEELGYDKEKILLVPELYMASGEDMINIIKKTSANVQSLIFFTHNPGITEFVNMLSDVMIDNIPTAAVYAVNIDCEDWKDFENAKKEFLFFDYPKAV